MFACCYLLMFLPFLRSYESQLLKIPIWNRMAPFEARKAVSMAEIAPLRALRYTNKAGSLEDLILSLIHI